jgi:hypothetical protein
MWEPPRVPFYTHAAARRLLEIGLTDRHCMHSYNLFQTAGHSVTHEYRTKTNTGASYGKRVLALIGVLSLIRLIIAFTLGLGNDESYYWFYAQRLQWTYFDHPPMVALWVRFFTINLELQHWEGFIRLGSVAGCALSTWFLFKAVTTVHSERAGWLAACLYNASFYAAMIAGIFIWPDAPQMVFWTFCLWMIARIAQDDRSWTNWLLLGAGAGLCIMCKVHGVFIWGGLGIFMLLHKREWLLRPQLYAAALITALIASPIFIWNVQHDFITYRFHSQRVTINKSSVNPDSFTFELLGQFLLNNPFTVLLVFAALAAWHKKEMSRTTALCAFNYIGLPLASVLLCISVFRDTYPHWSGPAYVSMIPLAAVYLAGVDKRSLFPKKIRWALGGYLVFLAGWQLLVHFYPGTMGDKHHQTLGSGDVTLDLHGWKDAGEEFTELYRDEQQQGLMPPGAPVVAWKWWGAHVDYYFCRPAGIPLIGLGPVQDAHHYIWSNRWRKDQADLSSAYCIVPSDEFYHVQEKYGAWYSRIEQVKVIQTSRSGKPSHNFFVYRLSGWKGRLPVAGN